MPVSTKSCKRLCRTCAAAALTLTCQPGLAAGHALGTDAIRWLDQEYLNVFYQNALTSTSGAQLHFGFRDSDNFLVGAAYKAYAGGYHSSVFYQAGATVYTLPTESDFGLSLEVGYERSPARNFVTFGSVKVEYHTLPERFDYVPTLGLMLAF